MKRTTVWLTTPQEKGLKALAKVKEVKIAELVRRAIDEFLDREGKKK